MRILVTGGAGFLGYHLARGLEGKEIVFLDTADPSAAGVPTSVRYHRGDVRDAPVLETAMEGCEAVIHAAAGLPLMPKAEILSVNLDGTRSVLESCAKLGVKRVVHISSTAVYEDTAHGPAPEDSPLRGVGPYGRSKVGAETLCAKARDSGQSVCILRPKTFLGSGRLGVFQILLEWVAEGRKIPVIGSGRNRYQLLAVEDLVSAVDHVLSLPPDMANGNFNVGADRYGTVAEDLGLLFDHAGTGSRVLPVPALPIKAVLALAGALGVSPLYRWVWATADQPSEVDISKLKKLGWRPRASNGETLMATWDWYLENRANLPEPGKDHRSPWREGILALARRFL